jgi:DNA-binding MarR family transcriptional regulator
MAPPDRDDALTLEILETIGARSDVTQRHLADRLGVALGLANSYLRRCARKGLIKIQQAPANRYLYYLTPQGFAEKSRLTAQYLKASFDMYRRTSDATVEVLQQCEARGWRRLLACGVSEVTEVLSVRAHDFEVELIGTFDPDSRLGRFIGRPVWQRFEDVVAFDGCVFTALVNSEQRHRELIVRLGSDAVIVPATLTALVQVNPVEAAP